MADTFGIQLTCSPDDADRTSVAFIMANAALAQGKQVVVFLMLDAVYLGLNGKAESVSEPGLTPMATLWAEFLSSGGEIWLCRNCFVKRALNEADLAPGVQLRGSPQFAEYACTAAATLSY